MAIKEVKRNKDCHGAGKKDGRLKTIGIFFLFSDESKIMNGYDE